MTDSVAVSIVSFNGKSLLRACLDAVLRQTYQPTEVFVVDNASEDGTVDFVSGSFPTVQVIPSKINLGFGAGHNLVIRRTKTQFVLVLNQDAFLAPTFLEELVGAMKTHPNVGICGGKLLSLRPGLEHSETGDVIDMTWLDIEKRRRQICYAHGHLDKGEPSVPTYVFAMDGAAMLLRRSMLSELEIDNQFFDEDFFAGKEDLDISWRAQLLGWKCLFVPTAVGHHLRTFTPRDKRTGIPDNLRTSSVRNRYLLMIKNDLVQHWLMHFPHIALHDIKMIGYVLLYERSSLKGYTQVLKLMPKTLRKRRAIMSRKKVASEYILGWFK